ncbi:MAG TPA: methylenetetrahydromethanopterin dehydrogenase [Gammaproteobacteria bacterium]|nr:methylenetetrahydromethanopterin dehydrogenase [Gammaproteobacteria bacterium]
MSKSTIMHMFTPQKHTSPFDINMIIDAGYDHAFCYSHVGLDELSHLTQDAIFSRGPSGVKKTGIFIGGRDIHLAMEMMKQVRQAMVNPFNVSVFADPSGAFTTAAALVASVSHLLTSRFQQTLSGQKAVVFGGTGPVGIATACIAALQGAHTTIVDHSSLDTALEEAGKLEQYYGASLQATVAASDADKARLIQDCDIVFCTAKAGIQVLNASVLSDAKQLKIIGDVNAVPPLGVEGIKPMDMGEPLIHATQSPNAMGIGALAVGNVKYRLQQQLIQQTLTSPNPVYIDFKDAYTKARELL